MKRSNLNSKYLAGYHSLESLERMEIEKKKMTIGDLVDRITTLISSRIVYGGTMTFLGIRLVINPASAPSKISWGLGLAILLAAGGLLAGFFTKKRFNRENLAQIIEAAVYLFLGVLMIIFSEEFGTVLQEIVFVSLFVNSIANLFSLKNLNEIREKLDEMAEKRRAKKEKHEVLRTVADAMKEDFEKYNPDLIHATDKLKKKTDASTFGQVVINVAIALFSLILLVTRFRETIPIYGISGAVMVVSGINEIITVVRAIREMKRAEKLAKEQADDPAEAKEADNN